MNVTPFDVSRQVDYNELVSKFGAEYISDELLQRFERVTHKPLHSWLRRKFFFAHRQLDNILDAYENGEPIFIYTGRGPSSDALHIGHLIPFMFTKYLQDAFDCPVIIQIADEEKFYFKSLDFEIIHKYGIENIKDIIACGFNPKKTYIFSNREYRLNVKEFEIFVSEMKKKVSVHTLNQLFGLNASCNVGQYDCPIYQAAASFYQAFPHIFSKPTTCLVSYAIDQNVYFKLARDISTEMHLIKPCSIISKFISPLCGLAGKMSSSVLNENSVFLNDNNITIKKKL